MEQKKKNLPEVTLGQYKGLAVTRHVRPVTDKTVDIEVLHQTRMHAVYHPTTAPAKRGFRALLDFVGYMDGKEVADFIQKKCRLACDVGEWFSFEGHGFVRINLATDTKYIKMAVERIITNLKQL